MTKARRRFRKTGWMLVMLGLVIGGGFWGFVVPVTEGMAPDFSPHLSQQGFWAVKERALKLGVWRHDDGGSVGYCGGKEWVEKIIGWLREGKEIESCAAGHREGALALITNHEFEGGEDYARSWQGWWEANRERTQEQWIQQGFAEVGIAVTLPPVKEDWPRLIGVLGAAAGPSERQYRDVEMLYPEYLRYNAYRWLRDSGFEPLKWLGSGEGELLSVEQRAGLRGYLAHARDGLPPPPPGRLAFAPKNEWGLLGRGPEDAPWSMKPMPQAAVTMGCLLLVVGGLGLLGVRVSLVRPGV